MKNQRIVVAVFKFFNLVVVWFLIPLHPPRVQGTTKPVLVLVGDKLRKALQQLLTRRIWADSAII